MAWRNQTPEDLSWRLQGRKDSGQGPISERTSAWDENEQANIWSIRLHHSLIIPTSRAGRPVSFRHQERYSEYVYMKHWPNEGDYESKPRFWGLKNQEITGYTVSELRPARGRQLDLGRLRVIRCRS